jgi:diacylglycerol O-acyltransferase-1
MMKKQSGNQNYRGFFNLAVLLLAVSNIRLAIENYLKYGLLVSFSISGVRETDVFWSLIGYVQVGVWY